MNCESRGWFCDFTFSVVINNSDNEVKNFVKERAGFLKKFSYFVSLSLIRQVFARQIAFLILFLTIAEVPSKIQGAGRGSCSLIWRAVTWPCSAECSLPHPGFGSCLSWEGKPLQPPVKKGSCQGIFVLFPARFGVFREAWCVTR